MEGAEVAVRRRRRTGRCVVSGGGGERASPYDLSEDYWRARGPDDRGWSWVWESSEGVPIAIEEFQTARRGTVSCVWSSLTGLVAPIGFLKRILVQRHLFLGSQLFGLSRPGLGTGRRR